MLLLLYDCYFNKYILFVTCKQKKLHSNDLFNKHTSTKTTLGKCCFIGYILANTIDITAKFCCFHFYDTALILARKN